MIFSEKKSENKEAKLASDKDFIFDMNTLVTLCDLDYCCSVHIFLTVNLKLKIRAFYSVCIFHKCALSVDKVVAASEDLGFQKKKIIFFYFIYFFFLLGMFFRNRFDDLLRCNLSIRIDFGKSVKYRYIEFFTFDYDSLPISFQSGITFFL